MNSIKKGVSDIFDALVYPPIFKKGTLGVGEMRRGELPEFESPISNKETVQGVSYGYGPEAIGGEVSFPLGYQKEVSVREIASCRLRHSDSSPRTNDM